MKSLKKIVSLFLLMTLLLSMLSFAFAASEMVKHDNHEHSTYETTRGCYYCNNFYYNHCTRCHNSKDDCTCNFCPVCHHIIITEPDSGLQICRCTGL